MVCVYIVVSFIFMYLYMSLYTQWFGPCTCKTQFVLYIESGFRESWGIKTVYGWIKEFFWRGGKSCWITVGSEELTKEEIE